MIIDPKDPTIYERAAKILDENEWTHGKGWDPSGPVCLEGSIYRSCEVVYGEHRRELYSLFSFMLHNVPSYFNLSYTPNYVYLINDRCYSQYLSNTSEGKDLLIQWLLDIASDLRREQNLPELDLQVTQKQLESHEKAPRTSKRSLSGSRPLVEALESLESL